MWDALAFEPWGRVAAAIGVFALWAGLWLALARFVRRWLKAQIPGTQLEESEGALLRSLWLLRVWGVAAGGFVGLTTAGGVVPPVVHSLLGKVLLATLILLVGGTATEVVARWVRQELATIETPPPLATFARTVAILSGSFVTLQAVLMAVEVSPAPFLALGSVAALPLLFLLQHTASNLFYYFRLLRRQHLRVGDLIRLEDGTMGHVAAITWQDIRLRTAANNLMVVPLHRLNRLVVTNYHLPESRVPFSLPIYVSNDANPEVVEAVLLEEFQEAAKELPGISADSPPQVKLDPKRKAGDLCFVLLCQIEDIDLRDDVEQHLLRRIARRLQREGIKSPVVDSMRSDDVSYHPPAALEELQFIAKTKLADTLFLVASNVEPYVHVYEGESIRWYSPASGLTTALDPVARALGGVWVAQARGDADREMSDANGRCRVPPDSPRYTLRRLWLSREQEEKYYNGFSNRGLWPLCHAVYTRPVFEGPDWRAYKEVNETFAKAILEEVRGRKAFVFLQDFHLALVPHLLKEAGAEIAVAHFWHIPWPTSQTFSTCPWAEEILEGLLGNDLLGFHIRADANNFLQSVDLLLEAQVDYDRYRVRRRGKETLVRPFPISVDFEAISEGVSNPLVQREAARLKRELRLGDGYVGLGVDRIDYTKGIPERLRALDLFYRQNPSYRERFTFVQIGVPSRSPIPEYKETDRRIQDLVDEINSRHARGAWRPIIYLRRHHSSGTLWALYSLADLCIVSSLHDGMNLVAKEYVAARNDDRGALILSKFTGAARELTDAFLVNPYDAEQFAEIILAALETPAPELSRRMRRMRVAVQENDIYRWAGRVLKELSRVDMTPLASAAGAAAGEPPGTA
ncbi:MAG: trehalose-6-phosphate synthase [Chloroflexi bacterium]|nr:trehalose-6-phosphate synthase [Chloroflexota bacterium]